MKINPPRPIALIILDGFGEREETQHNAIKQAHTPHLDTWMREETHTTLSGSGHDVGLPNGQMGNSEVGHLTIGAGRTLPQELTRLDAAIEQGDFFQNPVLLEGLTTNKAVHIIGLLSPGGVHSHVNHILAMLKNAYAHGVKKLYLHAFLDGRDTPPQSALTEIQAIEHQAYAPIASMIGRYYAMDRDKHWDRIEKAYDLLTSGIADYHANSAEEALEQAYARGENDEFITATQILPVTIQEGDTVIFMNFRADRARQLTQALIDPAFIGFSRKKTLAHLHMITLTQYEKSFAVNVAYPPLSLSNTLGEYLSHLGLKQLRIAETEKYAHVTFFFNGGIEVANPGEDRILIPSPNVATYDLKPEMSAYELTDKLVAAIQNQQYDVIICNYANPDMVGHTGNILATIKAIEVIDECLGKVIATLRAVGGEAIITADHGNAECMFDEITHQPHTAHTVERVPMLYIGRKARVLNPDGTLADIAPTLLALMGLAKPIDMTGNTLISIS